MKQLNIEAKIYEIEDEKPKAYIVDAVDDDGDGDFFTTIFSGNSPKERAIEYATAKFTSFRLVGIQQ